MKWNQTFVVPKEGDGLKTLRQLGAGGTAAASCGQVFVDKGSELKSLISSLDFSVGQRVVY